MSAPTVAIGVDLGGTKIEAAVFDFGGRAEDGPVAEEIARLRVATHREEGYEAIVRRLCDAVSEVASMASVALGSVPIGVGMPGNVTRRGGLVKNSNTVCLNGRPFRQDVENRLGVPIAFDNDANCFALAEAKFGAGRRHPAPRMVFGVILGTGVGGGLVIDGRPWRGEQGIAGEWGHHAVWPNDPEATLCYCGRRGCLESYVSGPALEAHYERRTGRFRSVAEIAERRVEDADADVVMGRFVDSFARGLANVIDILDPNLVVLGGGVSKLELLYLEGVLRVGHYVFNDELTTPIVRHVIGDSAGVLGAAELGRLSVSSEAPDPAEDAAPRTRPPGSTKPDPTPV